MTEDQARVLSAMAGARAITCGEIAAKIHDSAETVWPILLVLERAGLVKRLTNSPGKPVCWVRTDLTEGLT